MIQKSDPQLLTISPLPKWAASISGGMGLAIRWDSCICICFCAATGFGSDSLPETYTPSPFSSWWAFLVGARLIEVAFDEWPFYSAHPTLIPAYWLGGLASHGVLLGATVAVTSFALLYRKDLLALFDAVVIPGSFLMGMGRIGNFIDGQIVGALTDVCRRCVTLRSGARRSASGTSNSPRK